MGLSDATINHRLQILGQAFKLAVRRGKLNFAPYIRKLLVQNARQGFFEHADFLAVLAVLPEHLKDFALFAYLVGWRKGEIASLRWEDVDLSGGVLRLRPEKSKNREGRTTALQGELLELIKRRKAARKMKLNGGHVIISEFVFHRKGKPIAEFRRSWITACANAKASGKLFHDLRRTAIRNMKRAGVQETVAMKISGHKTRAVFDRYNITDEKDLMDAMEKTQEYLKTAPTTRNVVGIEEAETLNAK